MILETNKYPDRELACFADLAKDLPTCTLNEWPIPISGNWLKSVSCVLGSTETMLKPMIDRLALIQLEELSDCLPTKISNKNCQEVLDSCKNEDELVGMYLPAPFHGLPLPPAFQDVTTNSGDDKIRFESTMERYEQFRQYCIPAEDRAIWERVPGKTSQNTSSEFEVIKKAGSAGASSMYFFGFFTGALLVCAGFFVYSKKRIGSNDWLNKPQSNVDVELKDLEFFE